MKLQTLNKLRCIVCRHQKLVYAGEIVEDALVSGKLICPQCNATFPVINGIPRLIIKNEITKSPEISVFDKYTERYDSWFTSPKGKVLFQNEVEAIKELIRGIEIGESLEIGVGTGAFAKALRIPYGVDPAWNSLLLAKRRGVEVLFHTPPCLFYRLGAMRILQDSVASWASSRPRSTPMMAWTALAGGRGPWWMSRACGSYQPRAFALERRA